jgi:hypothetical protein
MEMGWTWDGLEIRHYICHRIKKQKRLFQKRKSFCSTVYLSLEGASKQANLSDARERDEGARTGTYDDGMALLFLSSF